MEKQAEAATALSESIGAYVDAQTAILNNERAAAADNTVTGIVQGATEGYENNGIIGAVGGAVTSDASEEWAKSAAMFLPFPFNYIAIFAIGILFPLLRKWLLKKRVKDELNVRADLLSSTESTPADRLEEAKKAYHAEPSNPPPPTP